MELPSLVTARLDDESPLAAVSLGGDDLVVVTPTRTLVYRADGLLRDESVEAFLHEMDRLECDVGRRKVTFRMHYMDGVESFSVGKSRFEDVLEPMLGGMLVAAGVTDADETFLAVYRFSELTLVVTDQRVVKHVGAPVWDDDYEVFPFADVTDVSTEEGTVSTQVVLEVDGRPQRIKAPNESARQVRHTIETALLEFFDVDSLDEFRATVDADDGDDAGIDEDENGGPDADRSEDAVDGGPEPGDEEGDGGEGGTATGEERLETVDSLLDAGDPKSGPSAVSSVDSGDEDDRPSHDDGDAPSPPPADAAEDASRRVADRLDTLEATVERQNELLEDQQETIERLIEELRRGR